MATYSYFEPPLAVGGEKTVYRGFCNETGVGVAIKMLRSPYSPADKQRLAYEIARSTAGQGAGIAKILDQNLDWEPPFFVEEYFEQGSLATFMAETFRSGGHFAVPQAVAYITTVLNQLEGLHRRNIVHRDVKPDNIMLRLGRPVLVDMGIGRTLLRPTMLQTRAFVGTRGYAPPEQEFGLRHVDHRADIYACGVVFHELLTARRGAFNYITYPSAPLRQIIERMLAFEPHHRFPTAAAVLAEIVRWSGHQPSAGR